MKRKEGMSGSAVVAATAVTVLVKIETVVT